jgi:hypothetical protein
METQPIASLIGSKKADQRGIRAFIRDNIQSNRGAIESLADEVARTSKGPIERNHRLSILRVRIREICDELRIPTLTVKRRGGRYCLESSFATSRSAEVDSLEEDFYGPLRQAVARASPAERESMLAIVMEIFGISLKK